MKAGPFGRLRFLYVGSTKFDEDLRYYTEGFGADVVWNVAAGGARVAALRVSDGPLFLLADHRPARSCLPVYETENLMSTVKSLRALPGVHGVHIYAVEWPEAVPLVVERAGLLPRPKVKE